jgi:hypothetical protein
MTTLRRPRPAATRSQPHIVACLAAAGLLPAATVAASPDDSQASRSTFVAVIGGDLDIGPAVRDAAEEAAIHAGWVLSATEQSAAERAQIAADLASCGQAPACLADVLVGQTATAVIIINVGTEPAADQPRVTVRGHLVSPATGELLARGDRTCLNCWQPELLMPMAESLTASMLRELTSAQLAPNIGTHAVALAQQTEDSSTPDVAAELTARTEPRPPGRYWAWAAVGTGTAALAAGLVLVAVDGPVIKNGVRQPEERATMVPGIVTSTAGVALVATGATLWLRRRGGSAAPRLDASVLPRQGGAAVGLSGRF